MSPRNYPCPCCGYMTFSTPPGSDGICAVCGWQDDVSQLKLPMLGGGSNEMSLAEAQKEFIKGSDLDHSIEFERDPNWRPIDQFTVIEVAIDGVDYGMAYPRDLTVLYYWRQI